MHRLDPTQSARGLTFIDACITLVIACMLAGAAGPSFRALLDRRTLEGQASELASEIHYARSEAVARNQKVRLSVKSAQGTGYCAIVHTGSANDCTCDSSAEAAVCGNGAELIRKHWMPANERISLTANVPSMQFDPVRGMVTPSGTLVLGGPDGYAIHHVVTPMGRLRTCSPAGRIPGYKTC